MARKGTGSAKKRVQVAEAAGEENGGGAGEAKGPALRGVVGVDFYVSDYLKDRGIRFRRDGDEVHIGCRSCGVKTCKVVVSNDLGTWNTTGCGRGGGFVEFRRVVGDVGVVGVESGVGVQADMLVPEFQPVKFHRDYQHALFGAGAHKVEWLSGFGVGESLLREFRVGYNEEFDALVFPYLYRRALNSTSYLRCFREPDDWWKAVGDPITASWFGQHRFKSGVCEAVVAQTPLDALVLSGLGVENVLSTFIDNEKVRLRAHSLALLQKCDVVYVVPNGTDAGLAWARCVQEQLGSWRCKIVQLDGFARDVHGWDVWAALKRKAVRDVGVRVGNAVDWLGEVDHVFEGGDSVKGYPTKLEPLDKLFGGWRGGELTVLAGEPGAGKSTLAAFLSLLQGGMGRPVLHMTFEVGPGQMVRKWVQMVGGAPVEEMGRSDYVRARKSLANKRLLLPAVRGVVMLDEVERVINDSVSRFGVRHVVVDHLGFVSDGFDDRSLSQQLGKSVMCLKRVALANGVHVLALAHLRKKVAGEERSRPGLSDLFGSALVSQVADNVMVVRRPSDISKGGEKDAPAASVNRRTLVDLIKVRDDSGFEGVVKLRFDQRSLRYLP